MIKSFRNRLTRSIWEGLCPKGAPADLLRVARRKLLMLDAAKELKDLQAPPNNKLHALGGKRKGQHAIWINDQFRVCFEWNDGQCLNVEITDYHDEKR